MNALNVHIVQYHLLGNFPNPNPNKGLQCNVDNTRSNWPSSQMLGQGPELLKQSGLKDQIKNLKSQNSHKPSWVRSC